MRKGASSAAETRPARVPASSGSRRRSARATASRAASRRSRSGARVAPVEPIGAARRTLGRGRHRLGVLGAGGPRLVGAAGGARNETQPVELVGERGERRGRGRRGRSARCWEPSDARASAADRFAARPARARSPAAASASRSSAAARTPARLSRRRSARGPRRPEEHHGADAGAARERPSPRSRSGIAASGARIVTGRTKVSMRPRRPGRRVAAERAREERQRSRPAPSRPRRARRCREHRVPSGMKTAPVAGEPEVGEEAGRGGAAELDQQEDRERSEGGEDRRLRLRDHLVGEREDRRHHDRRARRGLECSPGWPRQAIIRPLPRLLRRGGRPGSTQ